MNSFGAKEAFPKLEMKFVDILTCKITPENE
jgi:hypothetical protein